MHSPKTGKGKPFFITVFVSNNPRAEFDDTGQTFGNTFDYANNCRPQKNDI
jgi:hypothetical protein